MLTKLGYVLFILYIITVSYCRASSGDRSYVFIRCVGDCLEKNCTNLTETESKPPRKYSVLFLFCHNIKKYFIVQNGSSRIMQREILLILYFYGTVMMNVNTNVLGRRSIAS